MSRTLADIAQQLCTPQTVRKKKTTEVEESQEVPKVQLIYAFNGVGKTRLSRAFKKLVAADEDEAAATTPSRGKILYYNAFTEDLFYWDNDLLADVEPKLKIQPNSFTDWIFQEQGQDQNVITTFQRYVGEKLTPRFNEGRSETDENGNKITVKAFSEVTFTLEHGDNERSGNLKISKGEESNFIWSIFYTLLEQAINVLNVTEPEERETSQFDQLEYVFIDDPVSSLDENHLIQLAVDLAALIRSSQSELKFVVTTHNPLFHNVLYNELKLKAFYLLSHLEDGSFNLETKQGDSNSSFSYHLHLRRTIEQAIASNQVQRYHFTLLRNLYEKTASFLGYPRWSELLPDDKKLYLSRIINFTSHSTLSNEAAAEPSAQEKQTVKLLLNHLIDRYGYWQQ